MLTPTQWYNQRTLRCLAALVVLGSCGKAPSDSASKKDRAVEAYNAGTASGSVGAAKCTLVEFAKSAPVPEASGAAWLTIDGALSLVVVGDSGNNGAYAVLDPDSGTMRESGKLPLGGPGDDLEGAAVRGGKLYAISSPGWMRVWERDGNAWRLVDGPYPLGPVDLDKGDGNTPPEGDGMVCAQKKTNCGRNYEGLCLAPETAIGASPCIGFAAAKADGRLYCLVERDGKLALDRSVASIAITKPGSLADCAFSDDGTLFAGSNTFDLNAVYRVDGWRAPASAKVVDVGSYGPGFCEVIAARGDFLYRMSDFGGSPSAMAKYRCTR